MIGSYEFPWVENVFGGTAEEYLGNNEGLELEKGCQSSTCDMKAPIHSDRQGQAVSCGPEADSLSVNEVCSPEILTAMSPGFFRINYSNLIRLIIELPWQQYVLFSAGHGIRSSHLIKLSCFGHSNTTTDSSPW